MTNSSRMWGFDPTVIKDKIILWLDFTDSSTLTLDTGKIVTVADKSGKGFDFTQSTPANRFTLVQNAINGRQAARCAGTPEFMENPSSLPISDFYIVFTNTLAAPTGRVFGFAPPNIGSIYELGYVSASKLYTYTRTLKPIRSVSITSLLTPHIVHVRMAGDASNGVFVDGVDRTEVADPLAEATNDKKNIGRGATSGSSYSYWSGGDISMILGFHPALNNREQKIMDSFLSSIFGI